MTKSNDAPSIGEPIPFGTVISDEEIMGAVHRHHSQPDTKAVETHEALVRIRKEFSVIKRTTGIELLLGRRSE